MPLDGVDRVFDLNLLGTQFQTEGDFEAARVHYMAALLLDPNNSVVLANLAGALYRLQKHEAAAAVGYRAIRVNPADFMARNNLAINLVCLNRNDEAREQMRQAMKLSTTDQPLWHTYGTLFYRQNKFDKAIECFEEARRLGYDCYPTRNDQALALMALGRLKEGLELYEVRWEELYKSPIWFLGIPEWQGEDLTDKTILVHHEQGFGDGIMFFRFLREMKARTQKVVLATQGPLIKLFRENAPDIPVIDCERAIPHTDEIDYHTPMLSMLRHLGVTVGSISPEPYLRVPKLEPTGVHGILRIGICWASGDHGNTLRLRRRIVPLEALLRLGGIPGVQLVSLQKGPDQKDIYDLGAEVLITDPMGKVGDFFDTAQIVDSLDLVLTVDSAVAHIAGALGKPTIVFGPTPRCWRWWKQPSGLPWYNDMQIFVQDPRGSWDSALVRATSVVENRIAKLLKERQRWQPQ